MEIERKFLVIGDFKHLAVEKINIQQVYLSSVPERTVRVRLSNEKGFLTIKGKPEEGHFARFEWEKEISKEEALKLLQLGEPGMIEKTRYLVKSGTHTIEIDEFYGENQGLLLAEIELSSEDEDFEKPHWLGAEVTDDKRYFNSYLSKKPYKYWESNK